MEFAKRLLIEAKVAVSPGIGFGEYGEGYVRIALVENEQRIRQAARNVRRFLGDIGRNSKVAGSARSERRRFAGWPSRALARSGAGVAKVVARRHDRRLPGGPGATSRSRRVSARERKRDRGVDLGGIRFETDPLALAEGDDVDVVVELIGGEEGAARAAGRSGAQRQEACGHRQQGAAGASRRRRWRRWRKRNGVALKFEAAVCGRHSDRQGAARRPDRL